MFGVWYLICDVEVLMRWCLIIDIFVWCLVFCVRYLIWSVICCLMFDAWWLIFICDVWYNMTFGSLYPGTKYVLCDVCCLMWSTCAAWCLICNVWCLMCEVRRSMSDIWTVTFDVCCLISDIKSDFPCMAFNLACGVRDVCCLMCCHAWCLMFDAWCLMFDVWCLMAINRELWRPCWARPVPRGCTTKVSPTFGRARSPSAAPPKTLPLIQLREPSPRSPRYSYSTC